MQNKYVKIKSSYFTFILTSYIFFIIISIAISICLYYYSNNFFESGIVILGVNSGVIILMTFSAAILISLALVSSKKISSPIIDLQNVAISISGGDFNVKADETFPGEVGNLGKALNKLSNELSFTIESLTKERNLLKQVINGISDGLISIDSNGIITTINPAFYALFNLKEDSFELLEEPTKSDLINALLSTASSKENKQITFKKGEKEILGQITTRFSENDDSIGAVCILRDITENTRLEQTRKDYVANVSHELRSPLTAIKGLIIPLKENMVTDEDRVHHFYDIIYNEINRLNTLVNDLFELSRLQSTHTNIPIRKVDAAKIILDQKEKYSYLALDKEIELYTDIIAVNTFAYGNIDRIDQLITILIDNAIKFTPNQGIITMSLTESTDSLNISVFNTGSFIPSTEAPHLFQRFYKIDKARTGLGAGLGLSIANEIISKMDGKIWLESEEGNGTTFRFSLKKYNNSTY